MGVVGVEGCFLPPYVVGEIVYEQSERWVASIDAIHERSGVFDGFDCVDHRGGERCQQHHAVHAFHVCTFHGHDGRGVYSVLQSLLSIAVQHRQFLVGSDGERDSCP
jgi:hypothetical protein